ncbi:MAG: hypothetical protein ACK5AV_06210 [Alphaproteobacteria bacterium]|jgi:hypothetical protein|nr:hypothetical protein [Candidatus Jidaibacter sp.]
MLFTFEFLGKEYGPKKLFLYSIPFIRAYNNNSSMLLCGFLSALSISSNKISELIKFDNEGFKSYVKKNLNSDIHSSNVIASSISHISFALQMLPLQLSKNLSNSDILLSSILMNSTTFDTSNKAEQDIHLSSVCFHTAKCFLENTVSNYCVNELLKYQLTPSAQLFALPLAQVVAASLLMTLVNPLLNVIGKHFCHKDDKPLVSYHSSTFKVTLSRYFDGALSNYVLSHSPSVIQTALFGSLEVAQDPLWL